MAIYSKICIMCNREFKTMRISTLFCNRKCANRSRSLPTQLRESLIRRNTGFTMIEDNRSSHKVQEDNSLLMALALAEARKRGIVRKEDTGDIINIDEIVKDNLKYVNPNDPALGGSDGFGQHGSIVENNQQGMNQDFKEHEEQQKPKGLRKLGELKS